MLLLFYEHSPVGVHHRAYLSVKQTFYGLDLEFDLFINHKKVLCQTETFKLSNTELLLLIFASMVDQQNRASMLKHVNKNNKRVQRQIKEHNYVNLMSN